MGHCPARGKQSFVCFLDSDLTMHHSKEKVGDAAHQAILGCGIQNPCP